MRLPSRSWLVPEVLQNSDMDCGPAALKAVMAGCGVHADYESIRQRCHADVDGTSLDALATLAQEFGLDARLLVMPHEHLLLSEAQCLPAIAAIRLSGGLLHFVVLWRRCGAFVQIMDPGKGRRWVRAEELLNEIPTFHSVISAERWRTWADSPDARAPWTARVLELGGSKQDAQKLFAFAAKDPSWRHFGALDAALRFVHALRSTGGVSRGKTAMRLVAALTQQRTTQPNGHSSIPPRFHWVVSQGEDPGRLRACGCVILHIAKSAGQAKARKSVRRTTPAEQPRALVDENAVRSASEARGLDPKRPIYSIMRGSTTRPFRDFALPCMAALACAGMVPLEGLLYRGLMTADHRLVLPYQRGAAMVAMVAFLLVALALEFGLLLWGKRLGRSIETRLRVDFLNKLPTLPTQFVATRPFADLFERGNTVHLLSDVPVLFFQALTSSLTLVAVGTCMACLVPGVQWVIPLIVLTAALPHVAQNFVREANQRLRSHTSAVQRTHLDALLGGEPLRLHGAEGSIAAEFDERLSESTRATRWLHGRTTVVIGIQAGLGFVLATALLAIHVGPESDSLAVLLLVYWAMRLPASASELSLSVNALRSRGAVAVRLMTVLKANAQPRRDGVMSVSKAIGPCLDFQDVTVETRGKALLKNVSFRIEPGEHVAIVGASGAGKSSILGLLLGWHKPSDGQITVDGETLDSDRIPSLRAATAWVDPSVQLWDASLYDNLAFGSHLPQRVATVLGNPGVVSVLDRLPDGMQTRLGESGKLLSSGQGQQVRIARAALRSDARLVLLDEPFRGLDAGARARALHETLERWEKATLLFVSHDIAETTTFARVLVVGDGRIVEQGNPQELLRQCGSHYARLHAVDAEVRRRLYLREGWKAYRLRGGELQAVHGADA